MSCSNKQTTGFSKNRQVNGPITLSDMPSNFNSSICFGRIDITSITTKQPKNVFEFGLRLAQSESRKKIEYEDRDNMYLNDDNEYVQNVFLGVLIYCISVIPLQSSPIGAQSYLGTGLNISS